LHLIAPLVNDDLLAQLSAEYTFHSPLNLSLPQMVIYQKGEEEDIDILEKPNIDLARAINDTLTDGLVFKTRSDKLMYLLQQQKEAWNSEINFAGLFSWLKNPFQFGNTFIIIILVLAVIYLYFRMNTMGEHSFCFNKLPPRFEHRLQA
jgi:hypothetical protein